MSTETFFTQAFVYLTAAVVAVPIAKRVGLGSVLGYLLAGVVIGPFVLGFVGAEGEDVMHFAEFGVVMMLFVIGLELEPSLLWRLRAPILGLGGLQVGITTLLVTGISLAFGFPWQQAVAIGMIIALSSTAIVLQTLAEKGLLKSSGGQSAFSVLLFQDIAVIPMLALMPLLATAHVELSGDEHHAAETWISTLPGWGRALAVLGAVAGIVLAGRYLLRPFFRALGRVRMREVFTAASLLLVIGIALLMTQVGLSPALGTFLAGVVLANSEYRHELEADIEPFKGLLLGLFFISVGASIDFQLIGGEPGLIAGLTAGMIALKFAVLIALARIFKLGTDQAFLFAFALPQVGEFAFVLLSFAGQEGVLGAGITDPLVASVALSMAVTPLLLVFNERVLQPRFGTKESDDREPDVVEEHNPVLIAGFGSFGSTVGRLLKSQNIGATVLDVDPDQVELLRRLGLKVYYGDATRHDLLETAGAAEARMLVVALDSPETTLEVVKTARKHFPQLEIFARAFEWRDAYDLYEEGVKYVYREALDTSLRLGTDVMREMGFRAYHAERATQKFLRHDQESLAYLATMKGEEESVYITAARQRIEDLERMLGADLQDGELDRDAGWDPETLREEFSRNPPSEPQG
ncbi:MAG: monovalent cation:proton antiporter-2 (CPA2) family protein [Longimicrobiales bacterium]|nr:monovalent cation:proton antiporter-2 (CPA2) family protein [Longimicrobiales bacterium]